MKFYRTALIAASINGDSEIVKLLISQPNIEINSTDISLDDYL